MKNLKKNSFSLALGLSMLLGAALAFLPAKADYEFGGKKACWTASSGGDGSYLNCQTCIMEPGGAAGPQQMGCKTPPFM
jgi:hypothetical protein